MENSKFIDFKNNLTNYFLEIEKSERSVFNSFNNIVTKFENCNMYLEIIKVSLESLNPKDLKIIFLNHKFKSLFFENLNFIQDIIFQHFLSLPEYIQIKIINELNKSEVYNFNLFIKDANDETNSYDSTAIKVALYVFILNDNNKLAAMIDFENNPNCWDFKRASELYNYFYLDY